MIESILKALPWLAKILAEWEENRFKRAVRKREAWRDTYESKKEDRRRMADLIESTDNLVRKEDKL